MLENVPVESSPVEPDITCSHEMPPDSKPTASQSVVDASLESCMQRVTLRRSGPAIVQTADPKICYYYDSSDDEEPFIIEEITMDDESLREVHARYQLLASAPPPPLPPRALANDLSTELAASLAQQICERAVNQAVQAVTERDSARLREADSVHVRAALRERARGFDDSRPRSRSRSRSRDAMDSSAPEGDSVRWVG